VFSEPLDLLLAFEQPLAQQEEARAEADQTRSHASERPTDGDAEE